MTPEQLTIDGELIPYPLPRPRRLTTRQLDLLRWMRGRPTVNADEVRRFYADPHGVMRRLERVGLVEHGAGIWWAT